MRRRRKSSGFLAVLRFVLAFPALPEYRPNPMAVPGPVAGAGLLTLAGLLGAWGVLRVRGRRAAYSGFLTLTQLRHGE